MAGVAQLVEHRFVVPSVAGSSPVARPIKFFPPRKVGVFLSNQFPIISEYSIMFGRQIGKNTHTYFIVKLNQTIDLNKT